MAETTIAANNKSVSFRGKRDRAHSKPAKPPSPLRKQATHLRKRGMISQKAAKAAGIEV